MRVKICGVRNEPDVAVAVKSGASAVGFLVGQVHASPDFILPSTASRLVALLPPFITPVIVTHLTEPESIMEIVLKTGVTTIQLHGGSAVPQVKKLSEIMPLNSKLILAAHILDNACSPELDDYYPFINAVLLDSYNKKESMSGGSGVIHNWDISAEIVKNCPLPVILSGGLHGENVAEAIRIVRPYAVDANSNLKAEDGSRSLSKCRAFAAAARSAFAEHSAAQAK